MSPSIESNRAAAPTPAKRPVAATPSKPARPAPPATSRDQLSLSRPSSQLDRLSKQLEGPLPAIPARPQSADWKSHDRANRDALISVLRQDQPIVEGLEDWKSLPQDLKLQLGARISNIQAAIYGFRPVKLRAEDGPYRGGFHPGNGGEITVGPKSLVSAREFLNTVVHEQTHALQWEKGNAAVTKKLDRTDPYFAAAEPWLDNFYDYQTPAKGFRAYRDQPIEAHAFATGDVVAAAVLGKN